MYINIKFSCPVLSRNRMCKIVYTAQEHWCVRLHTPDIVSMVGVVRFITHPFNPSSMSHAAATKKGAAVLTHISGLHRLSQDTMDAIGT